MLERFNPVLKILCLGLAVLVCYQLARLVVQKDPLKDLEISRLPAPSTVAQTNPPAKGTNSPGKNTNAVPAQEAAKKQPDLPPAVAARVERITTSELLAAVVRPLPMALLGIAGRDVVLRAPNGQTGLLREGEELGGVKLLQIGTNRVLIEHEQQKKELTLFSGFGGESLLPKAEKTPP